MNVIRSLQYLSLLLCICAFSCEAKDTKDLVHYKVYNPKQNSVAHVLTVDPKQVQIVAIRAQDLGQSLDTVGNIARRAGAIAAINGGYFRLNAMSALPAGILKINNMWHGIAYKPRGAVGWNPSTNAVIFDILQTNSQILLHGQTLPINAMNKTVQGDRAALFSDSYNEPVDVIDSIGIVLLDQQVLSIKDAGKIMIPHDGYMYNLSGNLRNKVVDLQPGATAILQIKIEPRLYRNTITRWNNMPFIVGGGPLLIAQNKKLKNFTIEQMQDDFINGSYARTALGILSDKRWVFVVVERSHFEGIVGLSITELQDFMSTLGCVAALNLDGGSSSTMYIQDLKYGSITDQPVADAVIILPR